MNGPRVAQKLAWYYRREKRPEEAKAIVRRAGLGLERLAAQAGGLHGLLWLQDLVGVYRAEGLPEDAKRVMLAGKEKGAQAEKELIPLMTRQDIDKEKLDEAIEDLTEGGADDAVVGFVLMYLPPVEDLKQEIERNKQAFPLLSMIGKTQLADQQIVSTTLGSLPLVKSDGVFTIARRS